MFDDDLKVDIEAIAARYDRGPKIERGPVHRPATHASDTEVLAMIEEIRWYRMQEHMQKDLYPKVRDSAFVMSILPRHAPDMKVCLEMGAAVLFDKPIIAVVQPGTDVPENVTRLAREVVEFDDEGAGIKDAMQRLLEDIEPLKEAGS